MHAPRPCSPSWRWPPTGALVVPAEADAGDLLGTTGGRQDHDQHRASAAACSSVDPAATRVGPPGAEEGRQRGGRRGRDGRRARRDRALQRGHRRRRVLRLLQRRQGQGAGDRRPRDRARRDQDRRVHRPGHRQGLQLHAGAGDERRLRRRTRHARDLGQGAAALGHLGPRPDAEAGHQAGRPRLPRRPDLQPADGREPEALRGVPVDQRDLPARRTAAGGRLGAEEPRPRRHLPAAGRQGRQEVLPGQARRRDRAHGPEAAEDGDHDAARAGRLDDDGRPQRLPRRRTASRRRWATAATTSTAWRRRPAAARPSARRSTSWSATTSAR